MRCCRRSRGSARATKATLSARSTPARALGIAGAWRPLPRDRIRAATLEAALERLDAAAPAVKERLLAACAATALADRRVAAAEGEVVRAVAASLGVPVPPLLSDEPARESRASPS